MHRHGLPRERLHFWTRRLDEKPETRPALDFVSVEVASAPPREEAVVEVGGIRVRVDGGASQALVARVLRAVKECKGAEAAGGAYSSASSPTKWHPPPRRLPPTRRPA